MFRAFSGATIITYKHIMIITYKHGIYELPHESSNDLRLRILGNWEISGKCLNLIE